MKISMVLLFLLKVLGIVLLVILAVLLLILLILLLTPINYRFYLEKFDKLKLGFAVTWFFKLLILKGEMGESGDLKYQLKLLGRPFFGDGVKKKSNKEKKRKNKKEKQENKYENSIEEDAAISMRSRAKPNEEPDTLSVEEPITEVPNAESPIDDEEKTNSKIANSKIKESKPRRVRVEDIVETAPDLQSADLQSADEFLPDTDPLPDDFFTAEPNKKPGLRYYYKQIQSVENKKAIIKAVFLLLKRILKGVLPKDFYLQATVGTGDPASTGYVCGLSGLLKMKFGSKLNIIGDFKDLCLRDVKIRIKGKIVPGYFVYATLRFLFTKAVFGTAISFWKGKR